MKLMEQKELLLRILPAISAKEAFDVLADEERETLEKPVVDNADRALNRVILKVEPTP